MKTSSYCQLLDIDIDVLPLYESLQKAMKDVSPEFHESYILRCAVNTLTIGDGSFKHVGELGLGTKVIRPNEVHHAPVLYQVVLQGISSQHYPSPRTHNKQNLI